MEKPNAVKLKRKSAGKKGLLIAAVALIIIVPLFLLASAFSQSRIFVQSNKMHLGDSVKLSFMERDIARHYYRDIFNTELAGVSRGSSVTASFNSFLSQNGNYLIYLKNYANFIETDYAGLSNSNITLKGFNNTFKIYPYNTTFAVNGTAILLSAMPGGTNYIESLTLTVRVNSSFAEVCEGAVNDAGSFPDVSTISVTYINITGGSCSKIAALNPAENNNNENGRQFYQQLSNPSGSIEAKYGRINGVDGMILISASNTSANISQLDIQYSLMSERIIIFGGNISISISSMSKNNPAILGGE